MEALELYPPWRQALTEFLKEGLKPGDVLTHDRLFEAFSITKPQKDTRLEDAQKLQLQFLGQFQKLQDALLCEHQIALRSQSGVGYEVVPPGEQTGWAYGDGQRRMDKEFRRMAKLLLNVNHLELSMSQRRESADRLAKVAAMRGMVTHIDEGKAFGLPGPEEADTG